MVLRLDQLAGSPPRRRARVLVVKDAAAAAYDSVLVAVDFLPASLTSVHLARALAPGARLNLLHVITYPLESQMRYASAQESAISAYRRRLDGGQVDLGFSVGDANGWPRRFETRVRHAYAMLPAVRLAERVAGQLVPAVAYCDGGVGR